MIELVGRLKEQRILHELMQSDKSEFVAVYGRRRVGKTFLIRRNFGKQFFFQITGIANATTKQQLNNFHLALRESAKNRVVPPVSDWLQAFRQLALLIEKSKLKRKVLFIDELPWFDTPKSGFVQALEYFWNSFASARNDVVLIACGSAASWMLNKLINSKGGLHNRVTRRINLKPFTLNECQRFTMKRKIKLDRYQLSRLYMAFGGIPFYWEQLKAGLSADQNIQEICFSEEGLLQNEFQNLFSSLFKNHQKHELIVNALAAKAKGTTRSELIKKTALPDAGSTTRVLEELELSGFIRKYVPYNRKERESLYQLTDFYTLFYLRFIQKQKGFSKNYWINSFNSASQRAWSGYAFELLCLIHTDQIKEALGISGIETAVYSWRSTKKEQATQIDLLIDRKDMVINICEIKFANMEFTITKSYAQQLRKKIAIFQLESKTRKNVNLVMITTFGLSKNEYATGLVQNELSLEDLFT